MLHALEGLHLPGVSFGAVQFTPLRPGDGKYADTLLAGIRLRVTDRSRYDPTRTAQALLRLLGPRLKFTPSQFDRLAGDGGLFRTALSRGSVNDWSRAASEFRARRKPFLLYPE